MTDKWGRDGLLALAPAVLRAMEPPTDMKTLVAEWQWLIDARALELEELAKKAEAKRLRAERPSVPASDDGLDAVVEATIRRDGFTSRHKLRNAVGCGMLRLGRSLARLTKAGRIEPKRPLQPFVEAGVRGPGDSVANAASALRL